MSQPKVIYLVICGASAASFAPNLLEALTRLRGPIYTFLTAGAQNIISPYRLADQQGHKLIDSYFDPALLEGREPGLTLVAPATFNTVNKVAQGIADTLPHSLIAEAIGAKWPVIIAPSLNRELAAHPQFAKSIAVLRSWGVTVLEPARDGDWLVMASVEKIVEAVKSSGTS